MPGEHAVGGASVAWLVPAVSGGAGLRVVDERGGDVAEVGDQAQVTADGSDLGGDGLDLHFPGVSCSIRETRTWLTPMAAATWAWVMPCCLRIWARW